MLTGDQDMVLGEKLEALGGDGIPGGSNAKLYCSAP